jgi:hypothetical protein
MGIQEDSCRVLQVEKSPQVKARREGEKAPLAAIEHPIVYITERLDV